MVERDEIIPGLPPVYNSFGIVGNILVNIVYDKENHGNIRFRRYMDLTSKELESIILLDTDYSKNSIIKLINL